MQELCVGSNSTVHAKYCKKDVADSRVWAGKFPVRTDLNVGSGQNSPYARGRCTRGELLLIWRIFGHFLELGGRQKEEKDTEVIYRGSFACQGLRTLYSVLRSLYIADQFVKLLQFKSFVLYPSFSLSTYLLLLKYNHVR